MLRNAGSAPFQKAPFREICSLADGSKDLQSFA